MRISKRRRSAAPAGLILSMLTASVGLALCCSLAVAQKAQTEKQINAVGRSARAAEDIEAIVELPAAEGIPFEIIKRAEAVAVVPSVSRVALIGLTQGYGVVSRRVPEGWTLPAYYRFGNKGLKLVTGKESVTDVIVFFMNEKTVERFQKGALGLEGGKTPRPGIIGPDISPDVLASTDIFIYVLRDNRLGEIEVNGKADQSFVLNPDNNMNQAIYGTKGSEVLFGKTPNSQTLPEGLNAFQQALTRYFARQ